VRRHRCAPRNVRSAFAASSNADFVDSAAVCLTPDPVHPDCRSQVGSGDTMDFPISRSRGPHTSTVLPVRGRRGSDGAVAVSVESLGAGLAGSGGPVTWSVRGWGGAGSSTLTIASDGRALRGRAGTNPKPGRQGPNVSLDPSSNAHEQA
jgi:hypothetical protein